MKPLRKLKNYYKINVVIYSIIFIWILYTAIKGEPYFGIFSVIFGLFLVYWIWKAIKEARLKKKK